MSNLNTELETLFLDFYKEILPVVKVLLDDEEAEIDIVSLKDMSLNTVHGETVLGVFLENAGPDHMSLLGRAFLFSREGTDTLTLSLSKIPDFDGGQNSGLSIFNLPHVPGSAGNTQPHVLSPILLRAGVLLNSLDARFNSVFYVEGGDPPLILGSQDGTLLDAETSEVFDPKEHGCNPAAWSATTELLGSL